jgi:predicted Fe-S protein YdhL (DUF1289 family)
MSNAPDTSPSTPLSPCTGVCRLDDRGYCVGCRRTGEEIARWRTMSDVERLRVMQVILPGRRQP